MRTGLGLLAGIAAVLLAIFFLDVVRRHIEEGPRLIVVTEAAPELDPGSAVWVGGRRAGRVVSVRFREAEPGKAAPILIEAVLQREVADVLREDAAARIVKSGLMAPMVLDLRPGSPDRPPFDFDDTLRSTVSLIDQDRALALVDTLGLALEESRALGRRLRTALEDGEGTATALRRDPALLSALERRLRSLEDLLFGGPEGGRGTLARIATDTALSASLERVSSSLERLSTGGNPVPGELLTALDGLQASLIALERDLETGRGALGRALHDTAIYRQADLLGARLDSLRRELLESPLRWLRFRLF